MMLFSGLKEWAIAIVAALAAVAVAFGVGWRKGSAHASAKAQAGVYRYLRSAHSDRAAVDAQADALPDAGTVANADIDPSTPTGAEVHKWTRG